MKRKTSSTPTRIYTYGCLPPTDGFEQFEEQLRRAHRYRNALVEIELQRRERIASAQREHDVLGPLLEVIENTETTIAEARVEARLTHAGGAAERREKAAARAALRELIDAAAADLSVLRWLRGWSKSVLRQDEALQAAYTAVEEWSTTEGKALRAGQRRDRRGELILAPYWGTYLVVEKAAEAWRKAKGGALPEAPKFHRYDGSGRVAVQLQKGLTVAELLGGEDTRLRVLPAPQIAPPVDPKSKRQIARSIAHGLVSFCRAGDMTPRDAYKQVRIRVGSDGRAPVWATLPFLEHRPLPQDGKVMWAWIIRRREGVRYKYELQVTVEAASFASAAESRKDSDMIMRSIAVDVGSRDLPDGRVRVAYWLDSVGARGEVCSSLTRLSSPTSHGRRPDGTSRRRPVPNDLGKCEDLQSIRSKNLDAIKDRVAAYKVASGAAAASPQANVTLDWLRERTERVTTWRSPARFGALYRDWQRHDGDAEVYAALGDYLKQDRHLLDWQVNEQRRYLARRAEYYKVFAATIARENGVIVLAARDYRREEWVPEVAPSTQAHESRKIMRGAAPGELREIIKRAAKKYGSRVVEIVIDGDTAWALDYRVCERLLAEGVLAGAGAVATADASAKAVQQGAGSLAVARKQNHYGTAESFKRRRLGTAEKLDPLAGRDVAP